MKARGVGVIAPSVKLGKLKKPVRLLPEPKYPTLPDWAFIEWKYRTVRSIWEFVGEHPEVAKRKGKIEVVRWRRVEGGGIDLIPAGFSSRNWEKETEKEERRQRKLERARRRIERLSECGKTGHILAVVKKEGLEAQYRPHRCHSIFCRYCSYENFKESYARLLPVLEALALNGRLSFLTLTHRNTPITCYEDVERAIVEAFLALDRFYQFRPFGRRNWKRLKREFARDCLKLYRNAKKIYGVKKARKIVRRQIAFFRDFERRYWEYIVSGSDIKLGQLMNAVVKFELTWNAERNELHPHWHMIVADFRIPKVLVVVIWRIVSGSEIVDLRAVDSVNDATAELVKYITKGWEFPEGEIREWVEAVMLGRKKFRVWGFKRVEYEEQKEEKSVYLWMLRCELKHRKNLHDVPRLVRLLRRKGKKEMFFDRLIVYDERSGVWEVSLYLRDDGKLIIKDKEFLLTLEQYVDEMVVMGGLEGSDVDL